MYSRFTYFVRYKMLLFTSIFYLLSTAVMAQDQAKEESPPKKIGHEYGVAIKVDLQKAGFTDYSIPFDVPFRIFGDIPKEISKVMLKICIVNDRGNLSDGPLVEPWYRDILHASPDSQHNSFYFVIPPLQAIRNYRFEFEMERDATVEESIEISPVMRSLIKEKTNQIYDNTATAAALATTLLDTSDVKIIALSQAVTTRIVKYYHHKDIEVEPSSISGVIQDQLTSYIADSLYPLLMHKKVQSGNLIASINNCNLFYSGNRIALQSFLGTLASKKDELETPSDLATQISTDVMPAGVFDDKIFCLPTSVALPVTDKNLITAALPPYQETSDKTCSLTASALDLLEKINSDPKKHKALLKYFNQATIDQNTSLLRTLNAQLMAINATLRRYITASTDLDQRYSTLQFDLSLRFPIKVKIPGKTTADFVTRGEWYITADLGIAWAFTSPHTIIRPYVGANFNFFPINRQANYSFFKSLFHPIKGNLLKSMSGVIGVTVVPFSSDEQYEDLFNNLSLITALGIRLTDGVRLSGGVMWAYKKDANPLKTDKTLATIPYMGLSLDLDLKKWVQNITGKITGFN